MLNLPQVPLALEIMAKPLEMGFQHHFEGDKPTNRLGKPEYIFSMSPNCSITTFSVYLQSILLRRFKNSTLALDPIYVDSTSALITALLSTLR